MLPPSPDDRAVCLAVARLDEGSRLGSAHCPLFLAVECGSARIGYLGLTNAAREWLESVAGAPFASECEAALLDSLLSERPGTILPPDGAAHVLLAVSVLATRFPDKPLRLVVTPLGLGPASGTGLACSRDPSTGLAGAVGVFGSGVTGAQLLSSPAAPIDTLAPAPWLAELRVLLDAADSGAGRPVRAEFVVEDGRLWIMSMRPAELHGAALVRAAAHGPAHSRAHAAQALLSVPPGELAMALAPAGAVRGLTPAARGVGVSHGIASGTVVLSAADAVAARAAGRPPVLVLDESRPEDLDGLLAAGAVVTGLGGYTSHAALVTRGLGVPCVTGLHDARVERGTRLLLGDGTAIGAGDGITVDGSAGLIYLGAAGGPGRAPGQRADVAVAAAALLSGAAGVGGMAVRVNAESAADARRGISAGAAGVGLCRIEHMLLGARQELMERLLLEPPGPDRTHALDTLRELLRADLEALLIAADGLPVAIRMIDPPRHEFLPEPAADRQHPASPAGTSRWRRDPGRAAAIRRLSERHPMLGVRGVRLNLLMMDLAAAQLEAVLLAAAAARRAGAAPRPELLVPMVSTAEEIDAVRRLLLGTARRAGRLAGQFAVPVGAMIETPRAALLAGQLAARCDFLSFGTNDLTALVWGMSRDDAESQLLPTYRDLGVVGASPFVELDADGVGALISQAVSAARAVRPLLPVGVCGEHAATEGAISFFARIGADYVSCAPPLVPVARLACAREAINLEER